MRLTYLVIQASQELRPLLPAAVAVVVDDAVAVVVGWWAVNWRPLPHSDAVETEMQPNNHWQPTLLQQWLPSWHWKDLHCLVVSNRYLQEKRTCGLKVIRV